MATAYISMNLLQPSRKASCTAQAFAPWQSIIGLHLQLPCSCITRNYSLTWTLYEPCLCYAGVLCQLH